MGETMLSRRKTGLRLTALACCGGLALPFVAPLYAQDEGGVKMTLGVSSTLRSNSNFSLSNPNRGSGTVFSTDLSFGVETRNSVSALSFDASTTARYANLPAPTGTVSGFEDPTLRLAYSREGARSRLSFNALYNKADLDFVDPLRDPVLIEDPTAPGGVTLVSDTGSRTNQQVSFGIQTGIGGPLGLSANFSHRELDYQGTLSPSLYDTENTSVSATLRADLTPTTQFNLTGSASDYTASDAVATTRENRSVSLGLSQQVDDITSVSASVGWSSVETIQTVGVSRVPTLREGTTYSLSATRELGLGSLSLSYGQSIDTNGSRDTLNLRHQRAFQTGAIDFGIGVTRGSAGSLQTIADISWQQELPRGSISASLSRGVSTNDALADVLSTRASATYNRELSEVASMSFGVNLARTEDGGVGATTTTTRSGVSVSYNRALTEDWNLSTGVEHRRLEDAAGEASDNAIFVTLGRSFEFRP